MGVQMICGRPFLSVLRRMNSPFTICCELLLQWSRTPESATETASFVYPNEAADLPIIGAIASSGRIGSQATSQGMQ